MRKLKEIFKDAKTGDQVWHSTLGWGMIIDTSHLSAYPILVQFETQNNGRSFKYTGIGHCDDVYPSLFEQEFELPIEYKEQEIDWDKVPPDTLVEVKDRPHDITMVRRFITFTNDKYTCAGKGKTLKTLIQSYRWKCCKLHNSVEPLEEWFKDE